MLHWESSSYSLLVAFPSQTVYANDGIRENPRESCKKSSSNQSYSFTPAQRFSPDYGKNFIKQEELQKSLLPPSLNRVVEAKSGSSDGDEFVGASSETDHGWTAVKPRGQNRRSSIKTKFQSVGQENKVQEWRKLESQSKSGRDWSSLPRSTEISRGSTHPFKRNSDTYQARKSSVHTNDTPKSQRQIMRPFPKGVKLKTPFRLCWHFSNGKKCPKKPCTFAHGREELEFWTFARESGMSMSGILHTFSSCNLK